MLIIYLTSVVLAWVVIAFSALAITAGFPRRQYEFRWSLVDKLQFIVMTFLAACIWPVLVTIHLLNK